MRAIAPIALLAVVLTAFAGCVGGEGAPAGVQTSAAGPAEFSESTGAIEGVILDGEAVPLAGAEIAILGTDVQAATVSAADGRFVLSNLPPGQHVLAAQKLGYDSASRNVEVRAGESTTVSLALVAIAVVEVYHRTIPFKGYFDCTWVIPTSSGPCGYIGLTNGTTGNPLQPLWVNSKRKWNWPVEANVYSIIHEITWTKGSFATGEKMQYILSHGPIEGKERDGTHFWCNGAGKSPVRGLWERTELDEEGECMEGRQQITGDNGPKIIDPSGMLLQSFVSTGAGANPAGGDLPVGGAYQQSFDLFITSFHGEPAPEGFSALADG